MTLISNFKATNSGYNNLFNNKEIGKLINYMILNPTRFGCKL